MKLEEIVGYLPYGLKVYVEDSLPSAIETVKGIFTDNEIFTDEDSYELNKIKPIFHPLSDLTKPITVDGKEFVPMNEMKNMIDKKADVGSFSNRIWKDRIERKVDLDYFPMWIIQLLYQWHFDIHGLIERGEAIDINTIKGD